MTTMESPKQLKFLFRRAHDGGRLLGCFMVPRQSKRQAPTSPSASSTSSRENFFSSDDPNVLVDPMLTTTSTSQDCIPQIPTKCARSHSGRSRLSADTATTPLLDPNAEATEESFVFSPLAPSASPLESPSFRTLSDPLLSTFSYNCAPVDNNPSLTFSTRSMTSSSKFGGRPHPLPPPASPYRKLENPVKPVWLPLPAPELEAAPESKLGGISSSSELRSTSGASSFVSTSSSEGRIVASEQGGVGSWSIRRGKAMTAGGLPLPLPSIATKLLPGLESFEFEDLERGTRNFAAECCMEKGEFGAVYRSWLKSAAAEGSLGRELAVVRLNFDENQTLKDWRTDVQMLSQLSDSNICLIKGYCAREETENCKSSERLLVFDQSPNGNLHDYLCGSRSKTQLDWSARISIVLGAARGLLYLHDRAPFQIVYREFQSSSVLLDKDYTPRLAGYGLAVTGSSSSKRSSFTSVMKRSQAHAKNNVWSFGLVLVELLTGKYSRDSAFQCDEKNFVQWAVPFLKDETKLVLILDPRMKGKCSTKGVFKVAELALRCLKKKEVQRPSMARVVDILKSIKENFSGRPELSSKVMLLPGRAPSFGGVSFRDSEPRSKVVNRKFYLDSGSSMSASSEDEDSRALTCALQTGKSFKNFQIGRAYSSRVF
ncbi:hypothetical protein M758_10G053700 [Ceratodon purpureus]|nr:hypothetical protein M758_10G053700 [Ceratodon purpureus]KAG0602946.1 hypothetical protein M758_10G053700 [Ceratodon purpureus]